MITPLQTTNLGSMCCWARILDPGNTGEWLCWDCKEHTSNRILQEVDVAILDFANSGNVYIHRLIYDNWVITDEFDSNDIESFIVWRIDKHYWNTNNLEYMYSESSPIEIIDDRKSLETEEE